MLRCLAFSAVSVAALYFGLLEPIRELYEVWSSQTVIAIRQALSLGS